MFLKINRLLICALLLAVSIFPTLGFGYEVPRQDSKTKYFFLFGPGGHPEDGKFEDNEVNFYIDVPESAPDSFTLEVYDPDTGGKLDQGYSPWDTEMEFSVSGEALLDSKTFGSEPDYDAAYYRFGPYSKNQGQKVGDKHRFTLKVKALKGDDFNTFNFKVSPDNADVFSDKFQFILLPSQGDKMYFYPEIPAGTKNLTVRNFDLDQEGGISKLIDPASKQKFTINDSQSGQWAETVIPVTNDTTRRFEYVVETTHQTNGHAGLQFKDDSGNILPIYFRKGPAPAKPKKVKKVAPPPVEQKPVLACNEFTFDARKSYDPNNQKLTYLWEFGDGATSDQAVTKHAYEKGGAYDVKLTVSDNSGLKCEKAVTSQQVRANTPPHAAFAGQELSCAGDSIELDASATQDDDSEKISYAWDFGDGTKGEGQKVSKTYEKGGNYAVVLNVNDNAGTSCSADSIRKNIRVNTAPVANAGKDISLCLKGSDAKYNVTFDGSGSYDADNDQLSYQWDFGDGTKGEGKKVEHEYTQAGQYTVKLSVNDQSGAACDAATSSINVNLNKAPVAIAGKDQSTCTGSEVEFDGSSSVVVEGTSPTYKWDFGDGETATGATARHTYAKGGNYQAVLTVDDGKGTSCSQSSDHFNVHVNTPPQVGLNQVEAACTGDKVSFDASSSSDPDGNALKYNWDFGDGETVQDGAKVSHQYKKGGTYTTTVTVDDGSGTACSSARRNVTVKVNTPPVANPGPNLTCCVDDTEVFDGSGSSDPDGDSLAYHWDFGDGQSADEGKTRHAYEKNGAYEVVLNVDDNSGTRCSKSSARYTANVNAQPVPVIEIKQK